MPMSGDICFVDSLGNIDRIGTQYFTFMTGGPYSGVPLGYNLCSSETDAFTA